MVALYMALQEINIYKFLILYIIKNLALVAFRTFPDASLYVEADEPSLYSRREKLSLQCAIRFAKPVHEVSFPPKYADLYEKRPIFIKSFGNRISPLLESANIKKLKNILHQTFQLGV